MRIFPPALLLLSLLTKGSDLAAPFPAVFESNAGQAGPGVRFVSHNAASSIYLNDGGIRIVTRYGSLGLAWEGCDPNAEISGGGQQTAWINYFVGDDPSRWLTGVANYQSVRYRGIYRGVDAVFYRRNGALEFDLMLEPGADPRRIRLKLAGPKARLDRDGNLVFENGLVLRTPVVYQESNGSRRAVHARFRRLGARHVGFAIASYDRSKTLVIDPVLAYSAQLGDASPNDSTSIYGVAADRAGNAYVTGVTFASDFPLIAPLQGRYGGPNSDAFVAKISADGSTLLWSTYLGGSNTDQGNAIAVDSNGAAWVTGVTESADFPTFNPLRPSRHAADASGGTGFVAKISADGSRLLFSSYLGGSQAENPSAIAVDSTGAPYITGVTYSPDFPVLNAFQALPKSSFGHAFVTKLQLDGSGILYSTYLGGSAADQGMGIAVDASGSAYVTGDTQSPDFPVKNAFQPAIPGSSNIYSGYPPTAFVTKLSSDGQSLLYSTFLGGETYDGGVAIAVDSAHSAYVLGRTASPNFPTKNAFQSSSNGGTHAFVSKLSADGSSLVYSTYLGGTDGSELSWSDGALIYNSPGGIAVDLAGHAFVAGGTYSTDFPVTADAFQSTLNSSAFLNAFFTELSPEGSALAYSTFMGGATPASAYALAVDSSGDAYVGGHGGSGFPTFKPFARGLSGGAFTAKFAPGAPAPGTPVISGVMNVDGSATIAPNSWMVIKGVNLASVTKDWTGAIASNGNLPTSVGGTSVTVGGQSAYIYYVSGTQINAIAPDVPVGGPVNVVVTSNEVASPPMMVPWNTISPALFLWPQNYVVATHLDYSLAVKGGVFPSIATVPAHPGETIILWGSGLGPVTPPAQAGVLTQTTGYVEVPVTVQFGLFSQTAMAAALAQGEAGVFQVAVTVPPNLAAGDVQIAIGIDGGLFSAGLLTVGP